MPLDIITVSCLSDNYAYLLRDKATGRVGLVDAPEPGPIEAALAELDCGLDLILITHHHNDHIAGVEPLRTHFGARVAGAAADRHRLPALDHALAEGDSLDLGETAAYVIAVPGHTLGHIAYHFRDAQALFSADSLMVMGCGRLSKAPPSRCGKASANSPRCPMRHQSIRATNTPIEHALRPRPGTEEPGPRRARRGDCCTAARRPANGPRPANLERHTNPFLRAGEMEMKRHLRLEDVPDAAVFAEIRRRKDRF